MRSRNVFDRLFPPKYDFFDCLTRQAQLNATSIAALSDWLTSGLDSDTDTIARCAREADEVRLSLEKDLVDAFYTPIDRSDIYLLSVDMDKVNEYARSTLLSMQAYGVETDEVISHMVGQLKTGAELFLQSVGLLKDDPAAAERLIPDMRSAHAAVEQRYRSAMAELFCCGDALHALKLREVYHHIKDASSNLDYSVDTLHSIIVGLI